MGRAPEAIYMVWDRNLNRYWWSGKGRSTFSNPGTAKSALKTSWACREDFDKQSRYEIHKFSVDLNFEVVA